MLHLNDMHRKKYLIDISEGRAPERCALKALEYHLCFCTCSFFSYFRVFGKKSPCIIEEEGESSKKFRARKNFSSYNRGRRKMLDIRLAFPSFFFWNGGDR